MAVAWHASARFAHDGHAVLIGDIVRSRVRDGWAAQELGRALEALPLFLPKGQPPEPTIGDEFQAVYSSMGDALHAVLICSVLLAQSHLDSRYGVAWGRVPRWSLGREPYGQDGPAWWAAREALTSLSQGRRRPGKAPQLRTAVRILEPVDPDGEGREVRVAPSPGQLSLPGLEPAGLAHPARWHVEPVLQALLYGRDTIVDRWDHVDRGLFLALLTGTSLSTAAGELGVSAATASLRCQRNGVYTVLHMEQRLRVAFEGSLTESG